MTTPHADPPAAFALGMPAPSLRTTVPPGGEAVVRVRVTNPGLDPLVLERSGEVRLRKADAIARGVRAAFHGQAGDVADKLVVLGQALAQEPVATVQVRYSADVEILQPGQSADIEIRLQVPEGPRHPAGWTAHVPLLGTSVRVHVDAEETAPPGPAIPDA